MKSSGGFYRGYQAGFFVFLREKEGMRSGYGAGICKRRSWSKVVRRKTMKSIDYKDRGGAFDTGVNKGGNKQETLETGNFRWILKRH